MFVPLTSLSDTARVWIYQAARSFTEAETAALREELRSFAEEWSAHSVSLHAYADIWYDRFIVLMADEQYQTATGCSVDRSVHFISSIEQSYRVALFERNQVIWRDKMSGDFRSAPLDQLSERMSRGEITPETEVFDNLVATKAQFVSSWLKPLGQSWHRRFL